MITDIKFNCSHCGQRMVVEAEAAGLSTECPSCTNGIVIPRVGSILDRDYGAVVPTVRQTKPAVVNEERSSQIELEQAELAMVRQELAEATTQVKRLEDDLRAAQSETAVAREALTVARAESAEAGERLTALQGALDQCEAREAALRVEVEQLKASATDAASELERLANHAATLARAHAEVNAESSALQLKLAEATAQLAAREADVSRLVAELHSKNTLQDDLNAQCASTLADLEAAQSALRLHKDSVVELQNQLDHAQAENCETAAKVDELTGELSRTQTARDGAQAQAESLAGELSDTQEQLGRVRADLNRLQEENGMISAKLQASDDSAKALAVVVQELEGERDSLRRSLSDDTAGRDLVLAREQLRLVEREKQTLEGRLQQITEEHNEACRQRQSLDARVKGLVRELEEAKRRSEANSEIRLRQDNEVLRGIIARQNLELEQKHVQVVRLKRARLALRLAYAAFAMGLLAVAVWAVKAVPGLGKLF